MTMAADGEAIWKKVDEIKAANPGNRCTKYLSKVRAPRRTTRRASSFFLLFPRAFQAQ